MDEIRTITFGDYAQVGQTVKDSEGDDQLIVNFLTGREFVHYCQTIYLNTIHGEPMYFLYSWRLVEEGWHDRGAVYALIETDDLNLPWPMESGVERT